MPVENIILDYMIFLNQNLDIINAESIFDHQKYKHISFFQNWPLSFFKGLTIQFEGMVIDSNYHFDNLMPINKQKREWKLV